MIGALGFFAHEGVDLGIRPHRSARLDLPPAIAVKGRLREDLAGQSHRCAHRGPVVGMAHVVEADARGLCRIGRSEPHPAAALRAHRPDMRLKPMALRQRLAVIGHGERQEVVLQIRIVDAGRGCARSRRISKWFVAPEPVMAQQPAHADPRLGQRAHRRIERDRLATLHLEIEFQMVLQVLAHAWQLLHHLDAERAQFLGRPDPGQLQQLRAVDRPAGQDHLARRVHFALLAAPTIRHTLGAPVREQHAGRARMRQNAQVASPHRRAQIGVGRAPAPSPVHRHGHASETLLLVAVVVRGGRIAGLPCRLQPGVVQRIVQAPIAVVQRTVAAAVLRITALVRVGAAEIGQHMAIAPALGALFFPAVEIERVAAHPDHAVDRGRTPQHLAARRGQPPSAKMRFRLGGKTPVVFRHVHRDRQRGRHLNQHRAIRAAELQQQHAGLAVLGQTARQYAARRAGADHDVVEIIHPPSRQSTFRAPFLRMRTARHRASRASWNLRVNRSPPTPFRNSADRVETLFAAAPGADPGPAAYGRGGTRADRQRRRCRARLPRSRNPARGRAEGFGRQPRKWRYVR